MPARGNGDDQEQLQALFERLGYGHPDARDAARRTLEEAGLTRPGKVAMAREKIERAERILRERLLVSCGKPACDGALSARAAPASAAAPPPRIVPARMPSDCQHCGGSDNYRAVRQMVAALARAGIARIVVLGGSPASRREIGEGVERASGGAPALELRTVDGTARRTKSQAQVDRRWAQLVVVWGATELDHKVSQLYSGGGDGPPVVLCRRRGVAALCEDIVQHVARG